MSKVAGAILSVLLVSPPYSVVVVGNGLSDGSPIVIGVVNRRIPSSAQRLHLIIDPSPPANTPVHWRSADGKNDIGPGTLWIGSYKSTYDAAVGDDFGALVARKDSRLRPRAAVSVKRVHEARPLQERRRRAALTYAREPAGTRASPSLNG